MSITTRSLFASTSAIAIGVFLALSPMQADAQQPRVVTAQMIDPDDIGGVVTGKTGPEAGVWVIAETTELGTRFAKMVVTDDFGRYVIPDLPKANYSVWVRGYGLIDSAKVKTEPGKLVNLNAVLAPSPAQAAQYYPAIHWYSMLKIPDRSMFPGTGMGPGGNGMSETFRTQEQWLNIINTNGCVGCHQLGNHATRTIPDMFAHYDTSIEAWAQRVQSGPAGAGMINTVTNLSTADGGQLAYLADWTDRIKAGELPKQAPARPVGLERNLVVTVRDWSDPKHYLHDLIASDKRDPRVNGYGPVYGATELSTPNQPVLDPVKNVKSVLAVPVADPKSTPSSLLNARILGPSPYWGTEEVWDSQVNAHSNAMDQDGRVWWAAQTRSPQSPPAYCSKESGHPSAAYFPQDQKQPGFTQNARQLTIYDPKTKEFKFVDTCFNVQHLNFAEDANNTIWLGGNSGALRAVVGWVNTKMFLETGDAAKSQGWAPLIVDTNGNGKPDAWNEPGQNDPTKDTRVPIGYYAVSYSPLDGSIWGSSTQGYIMRMAPGSNPPQTAMAEIYKVPLPGFGVRGADVDRQGVVWVPLNSGHMGAFDRRKCTGPLNGPGADKGEMCPEGWAFYPLPGPGYQGYAYAAESPYYTWVDQHNTLGLGRDVPTITGNQSDAIFALAEGKLLTLRVPYPMGFFAKWLDGRIDDASAGWKGRGMWTTSGNRTPFHIEAVNAKAPGAPGTNANEYSSPAVFHFQMRPNPLAH